MWHKIIAPYCEPATLPTVIAERCVHTLVTQASCRACMDACPVNAWVMDEESLGIDTEACDGCGLCASACPQGAIIPHQANLPVLSGSRTSALFACEKAGVNGKDGIIPCLHALGLQDLLQLYRSGMRRLCVATGDCASCIRGGVLQLPDLLEQLTGMLESRNLATITLQVADREEWNQQSQNAKQSFSGPAISRRAFFRKAATSSMTVWMDVTRPAEERAFAPPGKLLPRTSRNDVVPFSPRIDSTKCNGCNACARLCPQGAIALYSSEDILQYRLDAECCTGCDICVDVCDQKAVCVDHWSSQVQFELPLTAHRCRACGVPFHQPSIKTSSCDLCAVCSKTNHARNLFQVMEQTH
ncbi:MAG: 4Fe-4S binding protein [Gammaproteobacteria bacterium]